MGFTKETLKEGASAVFPAKGQKVTVHCTGYGKNRDMVTSVQYTLLATFSCDSILFILYMFNTYLID